MMVSISPSPQICMGCIVFTFSEIERHTTFLQDSIMAFFSCTTSQSLSVIPCWGSMALVPRKQISALTDFILAIASEPTVIFEFFEILSPIRITSILGWCMYSRTAGMLPEIKVALSWGGSDRAISIIVVPPLVRMNIPLLIRLMAFWAMIFF